MDKTIKSSRHFFTKDINTQKEEKLALFLNEYTRVLKYFVNFIWNDGISWKVVNKKTGEITIKTCCPKYGFYDKANFFDYKLINIKTTLSARALSSLTSQAMGIISSAVKMHTKRLYRLAKLKEDPIVNRENIIRLENKIAKNLPQKPKVYNIPIELSSKCATLIKTEGEFNYFLRIQSIGKSFGKILIPIRLHKHSLKLQAKGKLLGSFLISANNIDFRWEIEVPAKKTKGIIVGGDTGKNTLVTLSNNTSTDDNKDPHGHTLDLIMRKLARKEKGSKAFKKAQSHRKNFINWSIKQLNFDGIMQLNLEEVNNIFYKRRYSRFMSHWVNSDIENAVESSCQLNGVLLIWQDSTYRSQRCSTCGLVRKANRSGKLYKCKHCGVCLDADLNGAKNHEIALPKLPVSLRHLKLNQKGFFWRPDGLFNLNGSELRVPNSLKEIQ